MKFLIPIFIAAISAVQFSAEATTVKPVNKNNKTSFAIITDSKTFEKSQNAILNYRDAVENDGLATYIIYDNWQSPEQLRKELEKLYKKQPNLEGIVLIGDIPIAMVRNGQHLTTAFKMDEDNFPILESSVPSDRYYDCLDLKFNFIKQDEENPNLFYYSLDEECPQSLNPTFYSARIRYPEARGGDKYDEISKFLNKAALAKSEMKNDIVDRVVSFNGHGYNSDCLIAWMDEEKAYREHFPAAFKTGTGFKHWNYRMADIMRDRLFAELERPGIDIFMFHEHGAPTTQYIDGLESNGFYDQLDKYKKSIYSQVRRAINKGNDHDEVIEAFIKEFNLTPKFFEDFDNPEKIKEDSLYNASKDIETVDLRNRIKNPRFVMLDACYNGSFNEDDNIAGEYIFNPGTTLVAQGNTRNVLQDRWTIEMLGLLSHGARVGQYNKMVATLEGHLIGDPTVHFAPILPTSINETITLKKNDVNYWKQMLNSPYADLQSLSLRMLYSIMPENDLSPILLDTFKTSKFNTTRQEALKILSKYDNPDFVEAIYIGLTDPYERIARMSADFAGKKGEKKYLPVIVKAYIEDGERQRVHYGLSSAINRYTKEEVVGAINDYYDNNTRYQSENEKEELLAWIDRTFDRNDADLETILSADKTDKKRISAIRSVRNNPYHDNLNAYFAVISNPENSEEIRVNMAEALGWFNYSYRKPEIISFAETTIKDPNLPVKVKKELIQTINRMK